MFITLPPRNLNPNLYPPHPTSTYTCGVTTAPRVRGDSSERVLNCYKFCKMLIFGHFHRQQINSYKENSITHEHVWDTPALKPMKIATIKANKNVIY